MWIKGITRIMCQEVDLEFEWHTYCIKQRTIILQVCTTKPKYGRENVYDKSSKMIKNNK